MSIKRFALGSILLALSVSGGRIHADNAVEKNAVNTKNEEVDQLEQKREAHISGLWKFAFALIIEKYPQGLPQGYDLDQLKKDIEEDGTNFDVDFENLDWKTDANGTIVLFPTDCDYSEIVLKEKTPTNGKRVVVYAGGKSAILEEVKTTVTPPKP
ncbi:hypothetical protein P3T73_07310 [Kiritimatiellota bacterium B12222]|nr:hypothetical protein P3T73_07310 [Kiritimatiellota bacterium B12222]